MAEATRKCLSRLRMRKPSGGDVEQTYAKTLVNFRRKKMTARLQTSCFGEARRRKKKSPQLRSKSWEPRIVKIGSKVACVSQLSEAVFSGVWVENKVEFFFTAWNVLLFCSIFSSPVKQAADAFPRWVQLRQATRGPVDIQRAITCLIFSVFALLLLWRCKDGYICICYHEKKLFTPWKKAALSSQPGRLKKYPRTAETHTQLLN